jgi:chromosome segregation ATPase
VISDETKDVILKKTLLAFTLFAIAAFAAACNKEPTASQQLDNVKAETKEAAQDMKDYTYAEKDAFVKQMQAQLTALDQDMNRLAAKIESSSDAVKADAKPKLQALRDQETQLNKQLDAASNATESTWDTVKNGARKSYDSLKDGFNQSRQWISDKIAPSP